MQAPERPAPLPSADKCDALWRGCSAKPKGAKRRQFPDIPPGWRKTRRQPGFRTPARDQSEFRRRPGVPRPPRHASSEYPFSAEISRSRDRAAGPDANWTHSSGVRGAHAPYARLCGHPCARLYRHMCAIEARAELVGVALAAGPGQAKREMYRAPHILGPPIPTHNSKT